MTSSDLYFRQCLSGRDHGRGNPAAKQMVNFAYIVGDKKSGECLLVDPSWDPRGLCELAQAEGLRVVGSLATHYHVDHMGGDLYGIPVAGVAELVRDGLGPVHVHQDDELLLRQRCGLAVGDTVSHQDGARIRVGAVEIELIHTPGHSPGSACFRIGDLLLTGDTLFIQGCGRVDLPGSDPGEMFESLTRTLATLPGHLVVYPGHDYGGASATLAQVRSSNYALRMG